MAEFGETVADAYRFEGDSIELGRGVHDGKVVEKAVDFLGSREGKPVQREIIRGVFGLLRKRL
jgi:hypothetical protein